MNLLLAILISLSSSAQGSAQAPDCAPVAIPFPAKFRCEDFAICMKIDEIAVDAAKATCKSNGRSFNCQQLAEKYGLAVIGKTVEVLEQRTDTCHIEGGCGPRACITTGTFARESSACL